MPKGLSRIAKREETRRNLAALIDPEAWSAYRYARAREAEYSALHKVKGDGFDLRVRQWSRIAEEHVAPSLSIIDTLAAHGWIRGL